MATVTRQGEEYEEDSVTEEYDDESGEDTDSKLTSLFGIPIKFLVVGAAVLLLLLIAAIVFMFRGSSGDEDIVMPEDTVQDAPVDPNAPAAPIDNTTTQPAQITTDADNATVLWLDAQGNIVGFTNGSAEGTEVTMNNQPIGKLSFTTGTAVTGDNGMSAFIDTNGAGVNFNTQATEVTDVVMELRKLGYTGDEIAAAQNSGADLNAMVESARALRDEEAKEALERMSDSASEEFQHIVNYSIFCLPEIEFPEVENAPGRVIKDGNYTVNADYEKLDLRGNQLFIKLKIANETYAFMTTTPERWGNLPDTGNMVVRIDYTLYGMESSMIQFFIKDITELDVSQITVNPEDSATNLEDIVDLSSTQSPEVTE